MKASCTVLTTDRYASWKRGIKRKSHTAARTVSLSSPTSFTVPPEALTGVLLDAWFHHTVFVRAPILAACHMRPYRSLDGPFLWEGDSRRFLSRNLSLSTVVFLVKDNVWVSAAHSYVVSFWHGQLGVWDLLQSGKKRHVTHGKTYVLPG